MIGCRSGLAGEPRMLSEAEIAELHADAEATAARLRELIRRNARLQMAWWRPRAEDTK